MIVVAVYLNYIPHRSSPGAHGAWMIVVCSISYVCSTDHQGHWGMDDEDVSISLCNAAGTSSEAQGAAGSESSLSEG